MPDSPKPRPDATSANVAAFLAYLEHDRRLCGNSITAYRYAVTSYLRSGGNPSRATRVTVLAYLDSRKAEGLSASSIFQATIALRHYHRFLVLEGLAAADPMTGIRLPKLQSRLPQPLTLQEMEKLLAAPAGGRFKNVRNRAILELLYATGLRVSEAVGLQAGLGPGAGYLRARAVGAHRAFRRPRQGGHRAYCRPRASSWCRGAAIPGVPRRRMTGASRPVPGLRSKPGITRPVSPHPAAACDSPASGGFDLRAIQEMLGHKRYDDRALHARRA